MESPIVKIKSTVGIAEYIIKHYPQVNLKSKGTRYLGNCPFHDDKNPSFAVFPDGKYKCFSCPSKNTYGDIINFVSAMEGVSAMDACQIIALNEGLEISQAKENPIKNNYYDKMTANVKRYWRNLKSDNEALDYLRRRGVTDESIDFFRLGLTDKDEGKFRTDILNISNRLSFPILENTKSFSRHTKCAGMSYRTITPGENPKYKNDKSYTEKEDPLYGSFIKGNYLFGYAQAHQGIKESGYAILVEGYFDVIALHQVGLDNAVASMGTSITDAQIKLLRSSTSKVVLMLDNDAAGIGAMESKITAFYESGFDVSVCILDSGDPADVCLLYGYDANEVVPVISSKTINAMEYMVNKQAAEYEKIVLPARRRALGNLDPILNAMSDSDKKIWQSIINKRFDL